MQPDSPTVPPPVSARAGSFVPSRVRGLGLILLASVCFGSSGAIGKPAMLAGLSPEQVAATRIGLAAVVLFAVVGAFRPGLLRVRAADWPLLVGYGLLGVAGVQLFYFMAAARIPVGIAILLEFTSPVLVALWVRFVRRVPLPRPMWLGIALAMAGLAMVAQVGQGLRMDAVGLLCGLAAGLCSAGYFLLGERGAATRHPLGMVTWGMLVGAVAICLVAPPWTMPAAVLTAPAEFGPWRPPVWLLLALVAVFSTVLAYLAGITALRHLPVSAASVLALAEPVVAAAAAWLLLGEALTWLQLAGAVVLLAGATVVQLTTPASPHPGGEPLPPGATPG